MVKKHRMMDAETWRGNNGIQHVFGDEFGDAADGPKTDRDGYYNPSRVFGYGIAVPFDSEGYADIRVRLEEFDTEEHKEKKKVKIDTRKLPRRLQKWEAKRVARTARTFAYKVDKMDDLPYGWDLYTPAERMVAMTFFSICDVLSYIDSLEVNFVFDQHTALQTSWARAFIHDRVKRLSEETGRRITFTTTRSSSGEYAHPLQVTDSVSFFSLEASERGRRHNAKKGRIAFRALDSSDSIWYDDLFDYSRAEKRPMVCKNRRGGVNPPGHGVTVSFECYKISSNRR